MKRKLSYHGEDTCQNDGCQKKAYYSVKEYIYCGHHADSDERKKLQVNPQKNVDRSSELKLQAKFVEEAVKKNQGKKGTIICSKMLMMKNPIPREGFLMVFPNNKHQNRKDGFGCSSLSPMQLGPVKHFQDGLPEAKSIENYHQFNKCFSLEIGEDKNPLPIFYEKRLEGYNDDTPHRHKYPSASLKKMNKDVVNGKNIPFYSVHMVDGKEKHFTYVESRFFYAKQYEILAKNTADFAELIKKRNNGYNLQIVGYDAYEVTEDLYTHYCDEKKPFGHELCLYSLLVIEDLNNYPWNIYRKNHPNLYPKDYYN
jgi:hypothetical protein